MLLPRTKAAPEEATSSVNVTLQQALFTSSDDARRVFAFKHDGHSSSRYDTGFQRLIGIHHKQPSRDPHYATSTRYLQRRCLPSCEFRHERYRKSDSNEETRRLDMAVMDAMALVERTRLHLRDSRTNRAVLGCVRSLLLCPIVEGSTVGKEKICKR